ncbi:uncharacterized protein G2W53_015386 [Senna tora]|uniref:Uncharacterized protein n=1 Tax=Senna tora TaxID=362788 RepID=A0A834WVZ8_9FABA|nr:uncharacterized protein G2W53_015386 [Senna tora]
MRWSVVTVWWGVCGFDFGLRQRREEIEGGGSRFGCFCVAGGPSYERGAEKDGVLDLGWGRRERKTERRGKGEGYGSVLEGLWGKREQRKKGLGLVVEEERESWFGCGGGIGVPILEGMTLHEGRWKFGNDPERGNKNELRVGLKTAIKGGMSP